LSHGLPPVRQSPASIMNQHANWAQMRKGRR
jgi:hypothetical protein